MTKRTEAVGHSTVLNPDLPPDAIHGGRSVDVSTTTQLTEDQKVFKKLGLGMRECAHIDTSSQGVRAIIHGLKDRKFEPGWFRKILLWLSSLGGQQYKKAIKQFRVSQILHEGGEGGKKFLEALGKCILLCDPESEDLLSVYQAAYDLLAGAESATRIDFFINKLLLPCAEQLVGSDETALDETALGKNFSRFCSLNEFCQKNEFCQEFEQCHNIDIDKRIRDMFKGNENVQKMLNAWASRCGEDLILKNDPAPLRAIAPLTPYFNETYTLFFGREIPTQTAHDKFLKCFGENEEDQERNFRALVDKLKEISLESQDYAYSTLDEAQGQYNVYSFLKEAQGQYNAYSFLGEGDTQRQYNVYYRQYFCNKCREVFGKNSESLQIAKNISEMMHSRDKEYAALRFLFVGFAVAVGCPADVDLLEIIDEAMSEQEDADAGGSVPEQENADEVF
ncbi:MAG: hypothetical protein LBF94_00680 [Puniceicoccales bacterium]|jgi:hypothetical protein|nr:hypothetical protein [Puniceicoccales bacterium]